MEKKMFKKLLKNIYLNNPQLSNKIIFQEPIAMSNLILFKRYRNIINVYNQGGEKICIQELNMCEYMIKNIDLPIDKQSRWIGFIQRGIIDKNLTTVDEERNFSRNLFHNNYKEMNIKIPKTINLKD